MLLAGGGYAEKVAVPAAQVFPVPLAVSLKDAAAFPEVACTVWSTVFMMSRLSKGEIFLVNIEPQHLSLKNRLLFLVDIQYLCSFQPSQWMKHIL